MRWPGKKADPLDAHARKLDVQIARLEREIARLSAHPTKPSRGGPQRRVAHPNGLAIPAVADPDLRPIPGVPLPVPGRAVTTDVDARYNSQGVRKFDLAGVWRRWQRHFRGPTASNPRMVQYLAAGSVHGLRPLRYEKRVARNRFVGLFILLLLVLFGLAHVYFR